MCNMKIVSNNFVQKTNNFSAEFHTHEICNEENSKKELSIEEYELLNLYLKPSIKKSNGYGISMGLYNKIILHCENLANTGKSNCKFEQGEKIQLTITLLRMLEDNKNNLEKEIKQINEKLSILLNLQSKL